MHRGLYGINWELYKNTLWYAKAKNIEWVNESNIDLDKTRIKINRLLGTEHWDYFTTTEAYKSKCYAIGEFYGEPETDRTLDMAILIKDSIGTVKLMVIDNYNYENSETFEFIELRNIDDFNWVGHFNAVRKTEPLWSNWVKGKGDGSRRELNEVPDKEITYLPYDAMFVHAGESCGGGFIFWKDNQWNWLQQE